MAGVSATQEVVSSVIKWIVPALLTALLGWWAVKRTRWAESRAKRQATMQAIEEMAAAFPSVKALAAMADAFPSLVLQLGEAKDLGSEVRDGLTELNAGMADVLALVYGMFEMSDGPQFVCDSTGRNVMVNTAYAQMLRAGRDDLMDYRYKRFIAGAELKAYMGRFLEAAAEHREFEDVIEFCCADGSVFRARVRMVPHPRLKGPATHWFGTISVVEDAC